ncbi:hypothetical protein [Caballeronia sp. AZ10_KS36]|uniref:hypothetical protein n=1 Tax=Caballeronia sp. AZ10_KS36 TaxID=2921757 RepID=UPI002028F262|nr:hypothetical protein [Caballeronia sp. AZ10_KS36]
MSAFGWLRQRFGRSRSDADSTEDIREALDRIAAIAPQVRLANRYESRLGPLVRGALRYARELVDALPPPRDATPSAWADDAYLRAMFATSEDITSVIGQSHDLRTWFDAHYAAEYAYAVLSSRLIERRVLGVADEAGVVRSDVPRIAVSFDDKRMRICDETEAALRDDIVLRVIEQLALEATSRVSAHEAQREALKETRALLAARMQMLGRRGAGMSGMSGVSSAYGNASTDVARLEREIAENEAALASLGSRAEGVEQQLGALADVLGHPAALIRVDRKTLRLNRMNLVVEARSDERAAELTLHLAHLPMQPPEIRAVQLVRVARRDMPAADGALDDAARWLI